MELLFRRSCYGRKYYNMDGRINAEFLRGPNKSKNWTNYKAITRSIPQISLVSAVLHGIRDCNYRSFN